MPLNESAIKLYDKRAEVYQEKFRDLDIYYPAYDLLLKYIQNPSAHILDIGCGPGLLAKYLLTKFPTLKITGIDGSANMIELAKKNNPSGDFQVMDCRKIDALSQQFDVIICAFITPYISTEECHGLIANCSKLLKKSGIFYWSTMEGTPENSGMETNSYGDSLYINYYKKEDLQQIMKANHLLAMEFLSQPYTLHTGKTITDIFFLSTKL